MDLTALKSRVTVLVLGIARHLLTGLLLQIIFEHVFLDSHYALIKSF
jgi:hypothetical protein